MSAMALAEHNVFWILNLMKEIRKAMKNGELEKLRKKIEYYYIK